MPLGDSITAGNGATGDQSYRGHLYADLIDAGWDVDFVGSQSSTTAAGGDPDHEGHGGYTIGPGPSYLDKFVGAGNGNVAANVEGWLAEADPDVVLLLIGVNDYFNINNDGNDFDGDDDPGYQPDVDGPGRLADLVDQIRAASPDTVVVVSSLLPVEFSGSFAAGFNAGVPAIAESRDHVWFTDGNAAPLADGDWIDGGLHLSDGGAAKVADVYAADLIDVFEAEFGSAS
ncbi:MAG: GDSL-type esterase/lipase family protein [Actinomycetota bacterium]|nr:GDSL-type esterase/lipase family protein [Actinomycetota bacterium]